ncbi:MAG: hypothetical protein IJ858_08085 [Acidaminococcaceae bacterium]|nr:hypothetical protein [Acidaminococcaceae bacterium]
MEEYFKTADLNPRTYFYGAATCGGSYGISLRHLQDLLGERDCRLSYGRVFFMIANSTATWKKEVTYDFHRLDGEDKLVQEMAEDIKQQKRIFLS